MAGKFEQVFYQRAGTGHGNQRMRGLAGNGWRQESLEWRANVTPTCSIRPRRAGCFAIRGLWLVQRSGITG